MKHLRRGREKSMVVDWSGLPSDVVAVISSRLSSCLDYVHFRSVCTSWRFAAPKRPHLPLLLLKHRLGKSYYSTLCNFSSTADTADHCGPSPRLQGQHLCGWRYFLDDTRSPRLQGQHLCGSSCGWLYFLDNTRSRISLHSPITGLNIRLPVLPPMSVPLKLVLSSSDAEQCVMMAQCGNGAILLCRRGDASWTPAILPHSFNSMDDYIQDIIFYQGKFYAVTTSGVVFVGTSNAGLTEISPVSSNKSLRKRCFCQTYTHTFTKSHLVVSSGDLLLVTITFTNFKVSGCELFRLGFDCGQLRHSKPENLGGCAFFLGHHSLSLSVDESFPPWCRANCIYYTETNKDHIVVFSMDDGSISLITAPSNVKHPGLCYAKHWIKPSIC